METIPRNFDALIAFHYVALEASFSRAADKIGTSKAMVSKQVMRLEAALRTQLFQRSTRKVQLTPEGAALLSYTRRILELSDEAGRRMQDLAEGMTGTLKLAAPVSLGEILFPPLLIEMRKKIPKVKIEIDLSNDLRKLEHVDFAIRATETHAPDSIARPLGRIRDAIVAHPKIKTPATPEGLRDADCIINSHQRSWNRWLLTRVNEDLTIEVRGQYSTNHYPMSRTLALGGFGIAKLPLYLVDEDVRQGRLRRLFAEYKIATHPIFLVYLRSEYASAKKKIARDIILAWFKARPEFFALRKILIIFAPCHHGVNLPVDDRDLGAN